MVTELIELLRIFYTDADAFQWLTMPQPVFGGDIPLNMIAAGRTEEMILLLRRWKEWAHQ